MRVDPHGHIAAVGPAERSEPLRIRPALIHHGLHSAHIIFVIAVAPIVLVRAGKFFSTTCRTTEIRLQHQVAVGRENLLRGVKRQQRGSRGAAVGVQKERILARSFEVHGLGHDAVDFHAVLAALPLHDLSAGQRIFGQPGVVIRNRLDGAEFQIAPEDFRGMLGIARSPNRGLTVGANPAQIDHAGLFGELAHRAGRNVRGKNFHRLTRIAAEIDAHAVRSPSWFTCIQLEPIGQFFVSAAIGAGHKEIRLQKGSPATDEIGNPFSVRGPPRGVREFGCVGHFALLSSAYVQNPCGLQAAIIEARCRIAGKGDMCAVRRPARIADREIALSDLLLLTGSDVPSPELRHFQVVVHDLGVVFILRAFFLVLALGFRRHEKERFAIR